MAAILGFYLLAQCVWGKRRPDALSLFAVGASIPTLILLTYNQLAFGSPWDSGYFHHTTYAYVHTSENRLGFKVPDHFWQLARRLALGPLSRAHVLRADLVAHGSRLGRDDRPPVLGTRGRHACGGRGRLAREPFLSRMDRRLVNGPAAARSASSVCDAARGHPSRGRFALGKNCRGQRVCARLGRRSGHSLVSNRWRADSARLHRPPHSSRVADLGGPASLSPTGHGRAFCPEPHVHGRVGRGQTIIAQMAVCPGLAAGAAAGIGDRRTTESERRPKRCTESPQSPIPAPENMARAEPTITTRPPAHAELTL